MSGRFNRSISLGLLAVVLHAVLLFVVIPEFSKRVLRFYNQDVFSDGYDELAENLVAGNGYRFYPDTAQTLMREPGYPVFLAGIMLAFGDNFAAVKLANMCLALATAWLMMRLARSLTSDRVLQIVPPLLFLFHPATLVSESRGGVEILFTFLIVWFMYALYRARQKNTWQSYIGVGAVLGLAVLVRSTPMLFPLFLFGYSVLVERNRIPVLAAFRNSAVMVVMMLVVLSPWILRNYRLTGRFIPTASVLGVSAHAGQYICAHRGEGKPWFLLDREATQERARLATQLGYQFRLDSPYYQSFYSTEQELDFSSFLAHRVFGEYARKPLFCAECMSLNVFNFWFRGKSWTSTGTNMAVQLPYLILAALGLMRLWKTGQFALVGPLVLLIGYVMAVHVPILAQARYSAPLIPFLSILAAFGLAPMLVRTVQPAKEVPAREEVTSPAAVLSLVTDGPEKQ